MAEILWTSLVDKEQSRSLYQQIREVVHAKSDLLGEEALHQLLGVIDSAEGLNELVIEANQKGGLAAYRLTTLMQEAGEFASYADMCANALIAVFTDEITDWSPDSILMLAEIADEYMTYVEDVFLARPHRDEERQDTVDFDSVRASLGL